MMASPTGRALAQKINALIMRWDNFLFVVSHSFRNECPTNGCTSSNGASIDLCLVASHEAQPKHFAERVGDAGVRDENQHTDNRFRPHSNSL